MHRTTVVLLVFACLCISGLNASYGIGPIGVGYGNIGRISYAAAAPTTVQLQQNSQAKAAAITDGAGSKAAAAKLNKVNWYNLNRYGHEIGRPLLVRNIGQLTPLVAASLPPTSFVGQVDPGFIRSYSGRIRYQTGGSLGVIRLP